MGNSDRINTGLARKVIVCGIVAAVAFVLLLGIGLMMEEQWYGWWPHISLGGLIEYIQESGMWGVLVAIGLMVVHSFVPFPAELVALANGMVFGWFWGTVITWTGAMIGAMLSFGISKRFGRPFVQRFLNPKKVQQIDRWIDQYGPGSLMFSRFIPVIAFNLINYAAGLTTMRWWTFTWITGVGILPLTTLMVTMGAHSQHLPGWVWGLLLLVGVVLWAVTHKVMQSPLKNRN